MGPEAAKTETIGDSESLIIPEPFAADWGAMPLLILVDVMFGMAAFNVKRPIHSDPASPDWAWWAGEGLCVVLFLGAMALTLIAVSRLVLSVNSPPVIRIGSNGIIRPFERSALPWTAIVNFYTEDWNVRSRDYRRIIIVTRKRDGALSGIMPRKFTLMTRCLDRDNSDELDAALAMIARYADC